MKTDNEKTSPFTDTNGLVGAFLEDIADRPVPKRLKGRLAEIRQSVARGDATVDMALDIIKLFPYDKAA